MKLTLLACGVILLLCCCCDPNAPRVSNVGRFEVEDCGVVQDTSPSRRVYVLTDKQTGRKFLAVTDCGLLEITPTQTQPEKGKP